MNFILDASQKKKLLGLARNTIGAQFGLPGNELVLDDPVFDMKLGAFVTLHLHGDLRGCIGYIEPILALADSVKEMAIAAAFRDPRFAPLRRDEFEQIDLEISVLSPIEKINGLEDVVAGRDGLIISRGNKRGLLLPQVATEYNWDTLTFMQHTCLKAGLPVDAWQHEGTTIERFSAIVFGEKNEI